MNAVKINFGFFAAPPAGRVAAKIEENLAVAMILRAVNGYLYS